MLWLMGASFRLFFLVLMWSGRRSSKFMSTLMSLDLSPSIYPHADVSPQVWPVPVAKMHKDDSFLLKHHKPAHIAKKSKVSHCSCRFGRQRCVYTVGAQSVRECVEHYWLIFCLSVSNKKPVFSRACAK